MVSEVIKSNLQKTEYGNFEYCTKCGDVKEHINRFGLGVNFIECQGCGMCSDWVFDYDTDGNYE